jgi:DNA-3-methyladenine glycosylase II
MSEGKIMLGRRPRYWGEAVATLSAADAVLGAVIAECRAAAPRRRGDGFTMLARAIFGQQISVKAADAIWKRVAERIGGITPGAVEAAGEAGLRAAGLTRQKSGYLVGLAEAAAAGRLEPLQWRRLDDEAVIERLVELRGIGRWTAEMFLIFHLQRPDVLPLGDLGLRRAIGLRYADGVPLDLPAIETIAAAWRPWRTVATWYLWRSLDPIPVEY